MSGWTRRDLIEQRLAMGDIPEEVAVRLGCSMTEVLRVGEAMDRAAQETETVRDFEPLQPGRRRKCKRGHYLTQENRTAKAECKACKRLARTAVEEGVVTAYYSDDFVTLHLGDCLTDDHLWREADILVTDPPYGRDWKVGDGFKNADGGGTGRTAHAGIANDKDTATRDAALHAWGADRLAVVFGDLLVAQPAGAVQVCIYAKPVDAGIRGARGGRRRDVEAIYLVGPWAAGIGGETSIFRTAGRVAGPRGMSFRNGHPHAKPVDLLCELIDMADPAGDAAVADPFAGSGSTLVAAKMLGRRAIGVEIDERYCEIAAKRLAQDVLDFGEAS